MIYKGKQIYFLLFLVCVSGISVAENISEQIKLAKIAIAHNNLEKALSHINLVLKVKTNHFEALTLKGKCKLQMDMYNEALDAFNSASLMYPQEALVHYYKGLCEWKLKRYKNAMESFDNSLLFSPDNLLAYQYLGSVYYELNMPNLAKLNFDRALDLESDLSYNVMVKNRFLDEYGDDYKLSMKLANLDLKKYPNSTTFLFYRGILKSLGGDNWGAYLDLKQCVEINPEVFVFSYYKGYLAYSIKKIPEATEDFFKYLKKAPSDEKAKEIYKNLEAIGNIKIIQDVDEEVVFMVSEVMPEFPGGVNAMYKFIANSIKYPSEALAGGVEGRVLVQFVVNAKGEIEKPEILKGIGSGCEDEAMRVLRMMPKWKPGMQNGKQVAVRFTMPIFFRLYN